jgi:hypothetical protein
MFSMLGGVGGETPVDVSMASKIQGRMHSE